MVQGQALRLAMVLQAMRDAADNVPSAKDGRREISLQAIKGAIEYVQHYNKFKEVLLGKPQSEAGVSWPKFFLEAVLWALFYVFLLHLSNQNETVFVA